MYVSMFGMPVLKKADETSPRLTATLFCGPSPKSKSNSSVPGATLSCPRAPHEDALTEQFENGLQGAAGRRLRLVPSEPQRRC